jgi:hypothetical protein
MPTSRSGFGSVLALLLALGSALPLAARAEPGAIERTLDASALARLHALAPDQEARITLHRDRSASGEGDSGWNLRRLEVYAPDARLWVATARGLEPMPRSTLVHFVGARAGERLSLSLAPDLSHGEGLLLGEEGSFRLEVSARAGGGLVLSGISTEAPLPDGSLPESDCVGGLEGDDSWHKALKLPEAAPAATPKVATRKVTLAIDTDNELMAQKFSDNTANAGSYMAALVAGMSAIYEMEPGAGGARIKLEIGTQILRVSGTPDPYPSATGSDTVDQLNEFGAYWRNNYPYAGYPRAFALMISGKSSSPNSAAGIAWLVESGSYCAATGMVYGGQTWGHYSINRVFKFAGATAANDVSLVAHELGHNFGLSHTHCTNTSGAFPAATATLDRCYSGEPGCYTGATSCPTGSPGAPKGTLMSYCHVNGCGSPNAGVIHPVQVTAINSRIASQPSNCVVPIGGPAANQPPSIAAPAGIAVTEDVASSLAGIAFADPDAGSGSLTATFTVPAGSLTTTGSGVTVGGSATARTLTGTLAALNAFIAAGNLRYATAPNANGSLTLGITINDNGNTGTGGAQSASRNLALSITPVNDAPVITAPPSVSLEEDVTSSLVGISFSDPDAGGGSLTATFTVPAGSLSTAGSGVSVGGTPTTRTLTGTLAALNAFIAAGNLRYTTAANANGSVPLGIAVSDNGNTGAGGAQSATQNLGIAIQAVNDAPGIVAPGQLGLPDAGTAAVSGVSFSDVDSGLGALTVTLGAPAAVTVNGASGGGVTASGSGSIRSFQGTLAALNAYFGSGQASLTTAGFSGTGTLAIGVNDNGNTGSGGPKAASASVGLRGGILFANGFE